MKRRTDNIKRSSVVSPRRLSSLRSRPRVFNADHNSCATLVSFRLEKLQSFLFPSRHFHSLHIVGSNGISLRAAHNLLGGYGPRNISGVRFQNKEKNTNQTVFDSLRSCAAFNRRAVKCQGSKIASETQNGPATNLGDLRQLADEDNRVHDHKMER